MSLTKWSDINIEAKKILKPDLGNRKWDEITLVQKQTIWKHFINNGWFSSTEHNLHYAVRDFASDHKAQSYCNYSLAHGGPHFDYHNFLETCCKEKTKLDFENIFLTESQDVVYELVSYYINRLNSDTYIKFTNMFNDISSQFGLNISLNKSGIILRQEEKITTEIYEPVLNFLSDKKWEPVNRDLSDAFKDYHKNTPEGYSSCITHTVSSIQAFLQILVKDEIGKGEIAELVNFGIKNQVIPDDPFSVKILKDTISIMMQERQKKGDPHPKLEYANQKSARLLLNLAMIFMQHCAQL